MKREQALLTINAAVESFENGTWTVPTLSKAILNTLKYLVEKQESPTMEAGRGDNEWTINCVLFGAVLFKLLSQGQVTQEDAIAQIKDLSSSLRDGEVSYLLTRLQDLVTK